MQERCAQDRTLRRNDSYGGGERYVQGFGGETWGKETNGETQA